MHPCYFFSVSSCKDDDETSSGSHAGTYHYILNVANANDEVLVVLDSISSAVSSVSHYPDWATVTILDSMVNGHPVLKLTLTQGDPNTSDKDDVVVYSANQDKVILTLSRGYRYYNDNNSGNDEFSTNWENMTSVKVFFTTTANMTLTYHGLNPLRHLFPTKSVEMLSKRMVGRWRLAL